MKKTLTGMMIAAMVLSLAACGSGNSTGSAGSNGSQPAAQETQANTWALSSAEDVTLEQIIKATTPSEILDYQGAFSATALYENTGSDMLDGAYVSSVYAKDGETIQVNHLTSYADGYLTNAYFTNDPEDNNYYQTGDGGDQVFAMDEGYADELCYGSLMGYAAEDTVLGEVTEENGIYKAQVTVGEGESQNVDEVSIDGSTGLVTTITSTAANGASSTVTFDYSEDVAIDTTAKDHQNADSQNADSQNADGQNADSQSADGQSADVQAAADGKKLTFETVDLNGEAVTSEIMKNAKLVLLNYWEPWCGPCVGEMPDLQKLYEEYKDKGLLVLGVYSSTDMQADAEDIIASKGITYPILQCNEQLADLTQAYVPATYFLDGQGNILTDVIIGAQSYEAWKAMIEEYLGE